MKFPYKVTNSPFFQNFERCYEVWYWKLNSLDNKFAFWYRFTILKSPSKSIVEIWGILTIRTSNTSQKSDYFIRGIKNSFDLSEIELSSEENNSLLRINQNFTNFRETNCFITDQKGFLKWNLFHKPVEEPLSYNFIPYTLWRMGLSKNYAVTTFENLTFEGEITYDGNIIPVKQAIGMQGHLCGIRQGHSWAWAHGNIFYDVETVEKVPLIVDILTARAKLGNTLVSPPISSVYIKYDNQIFSTSSIMDLLKVRSHYDHTFWKFSFNKSKHNFIIDINAEEDSIAGVKYEDTDNTNLYCYNSKMATIKLRIIDTTNNREKILLSPNLSAFEWVQRKVWDKKELLI